MSFRVAIGGISHETNTYCKEHTVLTDFHIWRGEEIITVTDSGWEPLSSFTYEGWE